MGACWTMRGKFLGQLDIRSEKGSLNDAHILDFKKKKKNFKGFSVLSPRQMPSSMGSTDTPELVISGKSSKYSQFTNYCNFSQG